MPLAIRAALRAARARIARALGRGDRLGPTPLDLGRALGILADPETREPLVHRAGQLAAMKAGRAYSIVDGVPRLRVERSVALLPDDEALARGTHRLEAPPGVLVLDVGTKTGKGMARFRQRHWTRLGLDASARWSVIGIDLNHRRLVEARTRGIFAVEADASRMPFRDASFDVTVITELLEHVPRELAIAVLREARRVTRGLMFIQNPDFSSEEYLRGAGLKFAWMDWKVHPHHITKDGMRSILEDAGFSDFEVQQVLPVSDSAHPELVPLSAPTDTQRFEPGVHDKPHVVFDRPVFEKLRVELHVAKHGGASA